jgi:hypothetical protein
LWGDVDIPFPRPVHDFLLAHNLAERHRWVPDSGWTTFRIRDGENVGHAIWLMRLSYLRYFLRSAVHTASFLATEGERLHLHADLQSKEYLMRTNSRIKKAFLSEAEENTSLRLHRGAFHDKFAIALRRIRLCISNAAQSAEADGNLCRVSRL